MAKVLSTTEIAPAAFAIYVIALISIILSVGLVGVSIQKSLVLSVTAYFTNSGLVISTNATSIPWFLIVKFLKYLYVPPYTSSQHIIYSPVLIRLTIVDIAAHPDENVMQNLLFSNSAKHSSKAALVGFPHLV